MEMKIVDCISLYPTQSKENYPTGKYEIISDLEVLRRIKYDSNKMIHTLDDIKLIGIAQISILSPNLHIPLLGLQLKDQYVYGNCSACIKKKNLKACKHGLKNRVILATLCWNEINYAVSLGYQIIHVYECYQYSSESKIFERFFHLLSRRKMMYSEKPPKIKAKTYVKEINELMNFPVELHLSEEDIIPSEFHREHAKQDLNMIFGKLSQQRMRTKPIIIKSQSELDKIDLNKVEDVFATEKACFVIVKNTAIATKHNRRANSILYAYVLAYSRIFMHKQMMLVARNNAIVHQISNDSLYISLPRDIDIGSIINIGFTFGTFRDEFCDSNVETFFSFGTKSCAISFSNQKGNYQVVKARGFSLNTLTASHAIRDFDFEQAYLDAMSGQIRAKKIPQIRKKVTVKSLSMRKVLMYFQYSNCIKETRVINVDGSTKPYGFQ